MADPIWTPSPRRIAEANLTRFLDELRESRGLRFRDYGELWRWSIDRPESFWPAVWEFCGVLAQHRGEHVLENPGAMPGARWFPEARMSFAANLLRREDARPAVVFRNERGDRRSLSFAELRRRVAATADGLRGAGIVPGDRVAGFLPNVPETVIAMLAAATVGAVWSSCSPDFGARGVVDRFGQIEPRVLFVADGYLYNGSRIDSLARVREILVGLPSVERVVVIPYLDDEPDPERVGDACLFDEFGSPEVAGLDPVIGPFDRPVYILYSSGTTGAPKCIVHGAGGTLLQHLKELVLHTDIRADDVVFYFTTCGWMMWNWLVTNLAVGATVVLYDGSPMRPGRDSLWRMADEEGVSVFGTSAKYIAAMAKAGEEPRSSFGLESLRTVLSTGSPLSPEGFDWVYESVKRDVCLSSISGGTDIVSCFALGNPTLPVRRGELQCLGLGMAVEIRDAEGRAVRGEPGELCCARPFPSMPVGFWNDPTGERYRDAYFGRFPGVWSHGDWAEITEHGGLVIHGRSDAVLNPGGVRIGTAEIYRVVEAMPEIVESIAVGQEWEGDVRVVLFVVLGDGVTLDDALRDRVRKALRAEASPRHVPAKVISVPEIPRTISGKITELAVRETIHGRPVRNLDALANPAALEHFRDIPELSER